VEHHAVSEQLHGTATVPMGSLVDDLGQAGSQLGGGPVTTLLGEGGVAGEVEEGDGGGPDRAALREPGPLQARLGPLHGHVQHVVLEMPAVQQHHRALQAGSHRRGDVVEVVAP
jgi:hypothetical protein